MKNSQKWKNIVGPGVLFAATAIGVSHLVQSTTAGAVFGLSLLIFVILANVLKYPFFEFGSRYSAATGKTLIEGYYNLHPSWLVVYMLITITSMFFVTAAVGVVTIGFMEHLFGLSQLTGFSKATHLLLFLLCISILLFGKFNALENITKILGILLLITTMIAFSATIWKGPATDVSFFPSIGIEGMAFLIPLMGWMPTAIDLSTWNSMWTVEKIKQTGYHPTVKESVKEFSVGYWISACLAIMFLIIGAFLVYGTSKEIPESGKTFSEFVVSLYTSSIGNWAGIFISIAAFSIMFSTFITVLDGFSRAMKTSIELLPKKNNVFKSKSNHLEKIMLLIIGIGSLLLILGFEENPKGFKLLVNTATTVSFLLAPIIAFLNFRLVQPDKIGKQHSPSLLLKVTAWIGMVYLILFSGWFLIQLF